MIARSPHEAPRVPLGLRHYFVFGAAAAVGAGLAVTVDQATGRAAISAVASARTGHAVIVTGVMLAVVVAIKIAVNAPALHE